MRRRGARARAVTLGAVAAVAALALALGLVTWMTRAPGDVVRRASAVGGFAVEVPKRWVVDTHNPIDPKHMEFMTGHENAALGFLQRGGFWVSRWSAEPGATVDSLAYKLQARQRRSPREDWSLSKRTLGPHHAVMVQFTEHRSGLAARLRLGSSRLTVYELVAGRFVYQVGLWTLPRAGAAADRLEAVAKSLTVFAPRPWTADLGPGGSLRLPGGWVEQQTDLDSAVFFALAPGDPAPAWVYLFHYAKSPIDAVASAKQTISGMGGGPISEAAIPFQGRTATRLEFEFPDGEERPPAHATEWFVSDGRGGTLCFAVGIRAGQPRIADLVVDRWRF